MTTKLYKQLAADWYQLLTPVSEYRDEAELYHQVFMKKQSPAPGTILELGSGAGHNAYYLKAWYTVTLTDISEEMLSISRKLNPECEHFHGDMRTLRLNKTFDAVFIHDAVMYMTSHDDLKQALSTAFHHCKPGGLLLVAPDCIKDNFRPGTDHGGSDDRGYGLRYLEWMHDPDPDDSTFTVDYAYLMRYPDGSVEVTHDRHIEGLFSETEWHNLLKETGFEPHTLPDSLESTGFIGYKPAPGH